MAMQAERTNNANNTTWANTGTYLRKYTVNPDQIYFNLTHSMQDTSTYRIDKSEYKCAKFYPGINISVTDNATNKPDNIDYGTCYLLGSSLKPDEVKNITIVDKSENDVTDAVAICLKPGEKYTASEPDKNGVRNIKIFGKDGKIRVNASCTGIETISTKDEIAKDPTSIFSF